MNKSKKEIEQRALEAARCVSALIPAGEIQPREEPDFTIVSANGLVGIEVTELLPPAKSDSFSPPVAESSIHRKIMATAEQEYNRTPGSVPVSVGAFFWETPIGKYDVKEMACELAEFVRLNREKATPIANFLCRRDLPEGFDVITIFATDDRPWHAGDSVGLTLDQIHHQLAKSIRKKNALLQAYRTNLPDSPLWLLLFSGIEVSRGVPIPHGLDEWAFLSDFDRILFFSMLDNAVMEIKSSSPGL